MQVFGLNKYLAENNSIKAYNKAVERINNHYLGFVPNRILVNKYFGCWYVELRDEQYGASEPIWQEDEL